MLCERCQKNKATLLINEYTQGKTRASYLCNQCAELQPNIAGIDQPTFENFLSGILEMALGNHTQNLTTKQTKQNELVCSKCKMKASEFRKNGRFGCSLCYDTFDSILEDALKKIQPSNEHVGKVPKSLLPFITVKREVEKLKRQLKEAVEEEKYELAAKLRDQIIELEKGGEDNG